MDYRRDALVPVINRVVRDDLVERALHHRHVSRVFRLFVKNAPKLCKRSLVDDLHADDLTKLECVHESGGEGVVIVKDGAARLCVVYVPEYGNARAANFLADTIFEMTGVKPKVVVERNGKAVTNAPAFYIGDTAAAKKAKTTPEKFVESICSISAGREVCAHFLRTEGAYSVFQI